MSIKRLAEILHLNYIELFKIIGYLDKNENSMEPTIKKDSIIFVKRTSDILSNHIGAFVLNGIPMVKRYFSVDSKIFLRSDNNTNYPDILISSDDDFSIVGEFIGSISY